MKVCDFFLMINSVFKYIHFNIGRSGGSGNFMGRGGNYGGGSGGGGGNFGRGKCLYLTKIYHAYIYTVFYYVRCSDLKVDTVEDVGMVMILTTVSCKGAKKTVILLV